ncbi:FadR/GntR family transcriptional regulator [Dactylosporangium sp. CS-033363]|uniref:FadR/GntR family transcriptional regulator n=1 Tax=Dactylosporangium sp. CS-033363 TaxID=3239935 RepID=UPI003D8E5BE3
MQIHQPRLAEMVADTLRDRIITGRLKDGDGLPRQEDLLAEFNVSRPSLREALRILEAEGLITVRRGNLGGALVHAPRVGNAAYSVGLVLQTRGVPMTDLRDAIKSIEPVCAGLCAARADRNEEVLPVLRAVHEEVVAAVDDDVEFTRTSRRFHEQLVALCGNETMILVIGALESLWSTREEAWARDASLHGEFPDATRRMSGIRAHDRILASIEDGEVDRVQQQARVHLESTLLYALGDDVDRPVAASPPRQSSWTG